MVKEIKVLPKELTYKGKLIDAKEFNDAEGKHIAILSRLEDKTFGQKGYKTEIYAYKYTISDGKYEKNWEIKDFNPSFLMTADIVEKLDVLDIDKDGLAETVFMYEISPDGLDPITLKLMLHYKNKKYAIRGEIPQQESDIYKQKIDPAFDELPREVRAYAIKRWDAYLKKARQSE